MKKSKSVFFDLGFPASQSAALTVKAELYLRILDEIKKKKLSARDLESVFSVPQPRVSELLNGKISSVSIEKLLTYLEKLGLTAKVKFHPPKAS